MIKVSLESTGAIHLDLIIKSTFIQIQILGLRKTTQSYRKISVQKQFSDKFSNYEYTKYLTLLLC